MCKTKRSPQKLFTFTILHSINSACLIFIFTTKRTGISRFLSSDSSFHLQSVRLCLIRSVRERETSPEPAKRQNPHPPNRVCGCIFIDSSSLFFWEIIVAKKTTFPLAIYIFFSIQYVVENTTF